VGGRAEVSYARRFRPKLRAEASLRYEYTHAPRLSSEFHLVSLLVGITF
jgi:hypothetical protein